MIKNSNTLWRVGLILYRRFGVHSLLGHKSNVFIFKLFGAKAYGEALESHWAKRYSIHLYMSLFMILGIGDKGIKDLVSYLAIFNLAWHFYSLSALAEKYRLYHLQVMDGFFTFTTLFTLMINAGLNQRFALEKCIGEHGFSPYLEIADQQIKSGMSESAAFEELSARFREPLISRYFGCIIQGQRYGNIKMKDDLKQITAENWREKLNLHRKEGERMKTKLLFPLMFIFVGILLILMLPVIVQFNQII